MYIIRKLLILRLCCTTPGHIGCELLAYISSYTIVCLPQFGFARTIPALFCSSHRHQFLQCCIVLKLIWLVSYNIIMYCHSSLSLSSLYSGTIYLTCLLQAPSFLVSSIIDKTIYLHFIFLTVQHWLSFSEHSARCLTPILKSSNRYLSFLSGNILYSLVMSYPFSF